MTATPAPTSDGASSSSRPASLAQTSRARASQTPASQAPASHTPASSRRGFLRALAAFGGLAAGGSLLAACQPAAPTAPTAPTASAPTAAPAPSSAPAPATRAAPAAAASPAAASPAPASPATQASPAVGKPAAGGPVKIGTLLPFSQVYAQLGADILDGMSLYFGSVGNTAGGRALQVIREDEGVDAPPALQKVRKLIEQDQVDVFTGIVATPIAYGARDLLHNARLPSVISNAGGNDLTRGRKSPYIFRASFSAWQVAFPLGEYVAKNISKKVVITAADYGFGRESAAAFKENYEQNGGQVLKELFPKFPNTDYGPFLPEIQSANPEATYNFYSGSDAVNFVKQYAEFGLKSKIRLTGSGFLVEQDVLPAQGDAALGAVTTLHWARTLDSPENRTFVADWRAKYTREPSVFSVQGFDAARVIVEALNATGGNTADRDALAKAIGRVQFASPRGAFAFDPATNNVINPMYVREVRTVDGKPDNVVIASLGTIRDPG